MGTFTNYLPNTQLSSYLIPKAEDTIIRETEFSGPGVHHFFGSDRAPVDRNNVIRIDRDQRRHRRNGPARPGGGTAPVARSQGCTR